MKWHVAVFLLLLGRVAPALAQEDSLAVKGPWQLGHITIWLLEYPEAKEPQAHPYLTLEAALRTGRAAIHENNSQRLWIENRSDTDLFLQACDLIKGGQQDRMVASDLIVAAGMIGHPDTSRDLDVYCIERGRSTKRGAEPVETFSASDWMAPLAHTRIVARHELTEKLLTPHVGGLTAPDTEELKLLESLESIPQPFGTVDASIVGDAAQESIWNDVENIQKGLTASLKDSVTRNASPTSLELALENKSLLGRERKYEQRFDDLVRDNPRSTGFVYALDSTIVAADRYATHALFAAMWPKLLRSIAAEAMIENPLLFKEGAGSMTDHAGGPSLEDVQQFLEASRYGKTARRQINDRTLVEAAQSEKATIFATWDRKDLESNIHTSWIAK